MKHLYLLLLLILCQTAFAQKSGQLYISGYDKSTPFYFCNNIAQMGGQNIIFAFVNTDQQSELVIDSFHYDCDRTIFQLSGIDTMTHFDVGLVSTQNIYYVPKKEGSDTVTITGYYGSYSSSATIICHAVEAPPIAFYGIETVKQNLGLGYVLGVSDEVLTTDTLHCYFPGPIYPSDTAVNLRNYTYNTQIEIRACGEKIIDRIYRVGDSSEITVLGIPPTPYTMPSGSALIMHYSFIPHIAGRTPHYLVVHTTSDDYLVWSFEYKVQGGSNVREYNAPSTLLDGGIYPNPVSTPKATLEIISGESLSANLRMIDLSANQEIRIGNYMLEKGTTAISIPTEHLLNGLYLILIETDKGAICRKLVVTR